MNSNYIVVVVDGDVAFSMYIPDSGEARDLMLAAFTSNPTFILHNQNLVYGSQWDGTTFTKVVERPQVVGTLGENNTIWDGTKFVPNKEI